MLLMFFGVKRHAKWVHYHLDLQPTGMKAMLERLLLVDFCTIIIQQIIIPYHITCEHHIMTCEYHIISRESGEYHMISKHIISINPTPYLTPLQIGTSSRFNLSEALGSQTQHHSPWQRKKLGGRLGELRKENPPTFHESSWLFNRDPYNGL